MTEKQGKLTTWEIKHEPEPDEFWFSSGYLLVRTVGDHKFVCVLGPASDDDARLIAAAPELLEALEWITNWVEDHPLEDGEDGEERYIVGECLKTIAKTTGGEA